MNRLTKSRSVTIPIVLSSTTVTTSELTFLSLIFFAASCAVSEGFMVSSSPSYPTPEDLRS